MRYHKKKKIRSNREKNEAKWRLRDAFRQVAQQLGDSAERHVHEAFDNAKSRGVLPDWITEWERTDKNSKMDHLGVDIIFLTDVGPIFVQVKSSKPNARQFLFEHAEDKTIVVIVNILHSYEAVYNMIIKELVEERQKRRSPRRISNHKI